MNHHNIRIITKQIEDLSLVAIKFTWTLQEKMNSVATIYVVVVHDAAT